MLRRGISVEVLDEKLELIKASYNGHNVIYVKGLQSSLYKVDNQEYTKFKTTTPDAVLGATNIREVEINGNKYRLNFWNQMEYPFLLDTTPTELYKFIVGSNDASRTNDVLQQMVNDRKQINRDSEQLQGSIMTLEQQILILNQTILNQSQLNDSALKVIGLKHKFDSYIKLRDLILKGKGLISHMFNVQDMIKSTQDLISVYNKASTIAQNRFKYDTLYTLTHKGLGITGDIQDNHKNVLTLSNLITVYNKFLDNTSKFNLQFTSPTRLNLHLFL